MIAKIRAIALEYLPYTLQKSNLNDTLREYVRFINERHNDLIDLLIGDHTPPLSTNKAVNIYRIVQEIIDNTLVHAQATQLTIRIKVEYKALVLITQDNGIGFDYEAELEKGNGIGLNNIVTRTQLLKGKLKVHSVKGGGTMYIIEIPL